MRARRDRTGLVVGNMIRWLLWNLYCQRGRRCACLSVTDPGNAPPGAVVTMGWTCGGCGTSYERTVMVGNDGTFTLSDPRRLRVKRGRKQGIQLQEGESVIFRNGGPW